LGSVAVDVQQVSKRFRLYHEKYTSLKEKVIHAGRVPHEDLWALRDVSFEVSEGETVGILGRNGSGKSTLLKCVCGVLQPTSGQVVVRGKLAGLLELGAGFQQDLSGRENIYLNGSMLGMSKREVDRVFDDIVAFAELEQFIDNQVKFYSSGMYVRLGFAVAVNVDPDVLVIDEVLAVGDERFQRKCMDRVKRFQREGRTILFVSHSPDQVRAICDRAVVLGDGEMIALGSPGEAVRLFRERLLEAGDSLAQAVVDPGPVAGSAGEPEDVAAGVPDGRVRLTGPHRPVRIAGVSIDHPGAGERPYLMFGEPLSVRIDFDAAEATEGVVFVLAIRDSNGTMLLQTDTDVLEQYFDLPPGPGALEFAFDSIPFLDGAYELVVGIQSRLGGVLYDWREPAGKFEVMNPGKAVGLISIPHRVTMLPVAADAC
jgi:ABC-type polysaccharide/polyol phosphate transport system ATPase subunit